MTKDGIIATLAFGYSLWAIAGSGYEVVFKGFMLLMAGIPVFVWVKWRASTDTTPATEVQPVATDEPPTPAVVLPPPVVEPV